MADAVINWEVYDPSELAPIFTAYKAELLLRSTTGRVKSGSSAAQSYGMENMSTDQLTRNFNSLATAMGLDNAILSARPDFNTNRQSTVSPVFGA